MRYEKDRETVWQCALCIPALEGQDQSQHNRRISSTVWVSLCAFLYKENHRRCRWFQKAFAMPSPAAAESLPLMREVAKIFDF